MASQAGLVAPGGVTGIRPAGLAVAAVLASGGAGAVPPQLAWEAVLTGTTVPALRRAGRAELARHPTDPNTLYACFGNPPSPLFGAPLADGCWTSADGGSTWRRLGSEDCTGDPVAELGTLCAEENVLDIAVCPAVPAILYVATHGKGLFRSDDAGATWTNLSAGIAHDGPPAAPGHCDAFRHGLQTFASRLADGQPWTATAVAVDPTDCDRLYAGVADLLTLSAAAGLGDSPGVYRSADGGATWADWNAGALREGRVDPPACHPEDLHSHTAAPSDLRLTGDGQVVMGAADRDLDGRPAGTRKATSRARMFCLPTTEATDWVEAADPDFAATATSIEVAAPLHAALSLSSLDVRAGGDYSIASHGNLSAEITGLKEVVDAFSQSQGLISAPFMLRCQVPDWVLRNRGLPLTQDAHNREAVNVGAVAIAALGQPRLDVFLVGTLDADGAPPDPAGDQSFLWAGPDWGASWHNLAPLSAGLATSPTQGLVESGVPFAAWNAANDRIFASVLWYDRHDPTRGGPPFEVDNGIYRACPLAAGGCP